MKPPPSNISKSTLHRGHNSSIQTHLPNSPYRDIEADEFTIVEGLPSSAEAVISKPEILTSSPELCDLEPVVDEEFTAEPKPFELRVEPEPINMLTEINDEPMPKE